MLTHAGTLHTFPQAFLPSLSLFLMAMSPTLFRALDIFQNSCDTRHLNIPTIALLFALGSIAGLEVKMILRAMCGAAFLSCVSLVAGIAPTQVEINLGPFPVDQYFQPNTTGSGPLIYGCSTSLTVQQCVQYIMQSATNSWRSQGVTGVRFFFTLGGGWYSTPFDANGNVQSAWVSNIRQFFIDLKNLGVQRVTPTPVFSDGWSGTLQQQTVVTCGVSKPLNFFPWLPFGLDPANHNYPDSTCGNQSYYSAAGNPLFWGWQPFFNVIDAVLGQAQSATLTVADLDYDQELDLSDFTVNARVYYDNITNTDVIGAIRQRMQNHGFSYGNAGTSVYYDQPTVASFDCGSFYGDSAQLIPLSEMIATLAGPASVFGQPPYSFTNGLRCFSSYDSSNMISLPTSYTQPTAIDMHSQGAFGTTSDTQTWASTFYSDMWAFMQYRGLTGDVVEFGETNPIDNPGCSNYTQDQAAAAMAGYKQSTLYSNAASSVIMRPWHSVYDSCTPSPNIINPPFDPFTN